VSFIATLRDTPARSRFRTAVRRQSCNSRPDRVRVHAIDESYSPPPADSPESHAARGERQRELARALDALPAEQRTLIEDAYFLGLSHSELAARFRLPLGTVMTRVRRGMLTLRQQLKESFVE